MATALETADAAAAEQGWDVEVIDLRSLSPFDDAMVAGSLRRTGRAVVVHEASGFSGYGAEVAARLTEQGFHYLEAPILRLAGFDLPYPPPALEQYRCPASTGFSTPSPGCSGMTMPDFLLPDLGEGLTGAEIISWHVKAGDHVEVDQIVAEMETAKAVVEVPVPFAGLVSALHGEPGAVIAVGAPLISVAHPVRNLACGSRASSCPGRRMKAPAAC